VIKKLSRHKGLDRLYKTLLSILLGTVFLLLLLQLLILLPPVQNKIKKEGISALQSNLDCDVDIGNFRIGFPKKIKVNDICISKNNDTLFYLETLSVDVKLFPLLKKKFVVDQIGLSNGQGDFDKLISQVSTSSDSLPETKKSTDASKPWEFQVNKLEINSCYFTYRDETDMGYALILDFGSTKLELGNIDLETLIFFERLEVEDTYVSFEFLDIPETPVNDTSAFEFANIRVKEVLLKNAEFDFIDIPSKMLFNAKGDEVKTSDLLLDISREKIAIDKGFALNTTTSVIFQPTMDTFPETNDYLNWGQYLWRVEGNELLLEDYRLLVDYGEEHNEKGHFNNAYMDFYNLSGQLMDFRLDYDTLIIKLENVSGKEANGFNLQNMNGEMSHSGKNFIIDNLQIETPVSNYSVNLVTTLSPTNYMEYEGKELDLKLDISSENFADIDYFTGFLNQNDFFDTSFANSGFHLNSHVKGSLQELDITNLNLHLFDSTQIIVHGKLFDLMGDLDYNLDLDQIYSSSRDIETHFIFELPDSTIKLPRFIDIKGNLAKSGDDYSYMGNVESNVGAIKVQNILVSVANKINYEAVIKAELFKLDDLIDVGINSVNFELAGSLSGENLYQSNGNMKAQIDSLVYLGNRFDQLNIVASILNGVLEADVASADTNLAFDIALSGHLTEAKKSADLNIDARKIDLQRLGLYDDPFHLITKSDFKLIYESPEKFALNSNIHSLDFCFSDSLYKMHPINLTFNSDTNNTLFDLESYYYLFNFECKSDFNQFISEITNLPGHYLSDSSEFNLPAFNLQGKLNYPEAFARLFFSDLPAFKELNMGGHYNLDSDKLVFNTTMTGVEYGTLSSDSLGMVINGSAEELNYDLFTGIALDDLIMGKFNITGSFENSELISRWRYLDSFSNPYFDFTFQLDSLEESIVVKFIGDSLIFSYDLWEIRPDNKVEINPEYIDFKKFQLTSGEQMIEITSPVEEKPQDINLVLENFQMGSIEKLMALDTMVAGVADANLYFKNLFNTPFIEGTLVIDQMSLMDFDIGKFNLSAFKSDADQLRFDLSMTGENESITASGAWNKSRIEDPLDLNLSIERLDVSQLNYILSDYVFDAKGDIQGNIQITGKSEQPIMNGYLHFSNAGVGIKALNNSFTLGDNPITLTNNNLQFDNFIIRNKKNESAKITGNIALEGGSKTYHNLKIVTDNMEILNSSQKDSDILFGLLRAKAEAEIKGPTDKISIRSDVKIDKTTDITYIFPDVLSLNNNDGIVQYNRFDPEILVNEDIKGSTSFVSLQMLKNFKSRIEVEEGSKFNLYFDNSGKDFLKASLNGIINYNIIEENSEVSGTFSLESGTLRYSIPMVAVEEYEIEPGSFITLSNDVYNPYLNLVASASVRASTEGLMASNAKVMTFKILLYMKGELNDLQLRFDISNETSDALVSARLAQLSEEERNMNALNLLVRGSFLISLQGDELGSTSAADAQIDKFYANHLNHLISENINFVDLKFDVQSFRDYNSSGDKVLQRNYYYNIGKSFLNDRARINYKGSLGITSDLQDEQMNSHFVQNELEIEVKVAKKGNLKGVFFRKNKYEGLLEGEIIETGGGIRYSKDFYSLWDMFTNDKRQQRKSNLLNQKTD